MRHYEASTLIAAPPERVWAVLTDTAAWPDWDSGVIAIDGQPLLGAKLSIVNEVNPKRAFAVKIVELKAPEQMIFRSGMPLGLFTGQRAYTLAGENRGTRFTMREEYTGPLAAVIFKSIPDLSASFRKFAEGLKQQSE
jgi:uncharacterized protein YndB with AHSA1/START domain